MDRDPAPAAPRGGQLIVRVRADAPASAGPGQASLAPAGELARRAASIGAQPPGPDADGQDGDGPWAGGDDGLEPSLEQLPVEILLHVLGFLDVDDLLSTSRVSRLLPMLGHEMPP